MNYEIDNFTININLSNDSLTSAVYYISKIAPSVRNKIHIINYSNAKIKEYFVIDGSKNEDFVENTKDIIGKLIFVDDPVKSIKWFGEYLKGLSTDDYVLLNGAEKLLDYKKPKQMFANDFFDSTHATHLLKDENWTELVKQFDLLYEANQTKVQGLITNIYADIMCRDIILKELEQSNSMSITTTSDVDQNDEHQLLQKDLFEKINKLSLLEAISVIESERNKLGEKTYQHFIAMAHYKAGNISESERILEAQYNDLLNEEKLMLANINIITSKLNRAEGILNELYANDKYLKDLFPSFLRLYKTCEEKYDYWLKIALRYDPNNPAIIELNASKLSDNGDFSSAANEFRKLSLIQNQQYYELVARMNDILSERITGNQNIIKHIYEHTAKFAELKNEGNLRLANYFIKIKDSYFLAYKCLMNADLNMGQPKRIEIVKLKLSILKDELTAAKAMGKLKPFNKTKDADIIAEERTKTILVGIEVLAYEKNGYLIWRDFLEVQSNATWNIYAYLSLKEKLPRVIGSEISTQLSKSYIYEIVSEEIQELGEDILNNPKQTSINLIKLLRAVKSGEFDMSPNFNTFEEFAQTVLTPGEVLNNNRLRIICRYYLSIIFSGLGEHQRANNYALSTLELYGIVDEEYKILCLYLGLLSWGYSQYRIGRHTEGILCILASIEYQTNTFEKLPFLEEGVNIISRFLADEVPSKIAADLIFWNKLIDNIGSFNENLKNFVSMSNSDNKKAVLDLHSKIEKNEIHDINWAGDIVNVVALYAKEKNMDQAIGVLDRYRKDAIPLLEKRKDIRFEILYNWSFIYFSNPKGMNNFFIALELIELAHEDLQEKRSVSHREERASIGAQSTKIYKLYIDICGTLLHLVHDSIELKVVMEKKIEKIVPNLSPKSVIEQKNYYNSRQYTQEAEDIEKEYSIKVEEHRNLSLQNGKNINLLSEKAKIVEGLLSKLKEIHPNYMELKEHKSLSFLEIQQAIETHDVFFQCVLTTMGVLIILISKNDIKIEHKYLEQSEVDIKSLAEKYSKHMQLSNLKYDELEKIIQLISRKVGLTLLTFLESNYIERIYFVPDFELNMFPLSAYGTEKISLMDKTESIVNLIDYSSLLHFKKDNSISKIVNRIIGNSQDSQLIITNKWLKEKESDKFLVLDNSSDDLNNLKNVVSNHSDINTIAIYAHGVSDPTGDLLDGARGIEGQKKIFDLSDIINNLSMMENLILISCRAGSPNYTMIEESYGTWANLFERFNGNIISCRWDVSTEKTIELIDEVYDQTINNNMTIDKALLSAQKKMKAKYPDPQFWAGVEFWIN